MIVIFIITKRFKPAAGNKAPALIPLQALAAVLSMGWNCHTGRALGPVPAQAHAAGAALPPLAIANLADAGLPAGIMS